MPYGYNRIGKGYFFRAYRAGSSEIFNEYGPYDSYQSALDASFGKNRGKIYVRYERGVKWQ